MNTSENPLTKLRECRKGEGATTAEPPPAGTATATKPPPAVLAAVAVYGTATASGCPSNAAPVR